MKVVYFGTAPFAVPALQRLAPHVSLVISQPDRPSGRGLKLQPSPVKAAAQALNIPVLTPEKAKDPNFLERLRQENADVFFVAAYGQIVRQALLDIPPRGCINLHGSVLPRWRGAAPIQRAIEAGDTTSGVTIMQMDKGMDTGDIIAIESTQIGPHETAGELYNRLSDIAAEMAITWLPLIVKNNYPRTPQNNDLATHAPKVTKEDAEIKFTQDITVAYNRIRAFTPAPGPYLNTQHGTIKIKRAIPIKLPPEELPTPGTVITTKPDLIIAFPQGALKLIEVQPPGKKPMSGSDFANGARISPGECLIQSEL